MAKPSHRQSAKGKRGHRDAVDPADQPFRLDSIGDLAEAPGARAKRLEHLMFEEIYRLFRLEVNDPRLSDVVPTAVEVSPDLRNAKVRFAIKNALDSVPPASLKPTRAEIQKKREKGEAQLRGILAALERVTPFLRFRLTDAVSMKRIPELHFHRDRIAESSLRAAEIVVAPAVHTVPPETDDGWRAIAAEVEADSVGAEADAEAEGTAAVVAEREGAAAR